MKTRAEFLRLATLAATAAVVAPILLAGQNATSPAAAGSPQKTDASPDQLRVQIGKDPVFWVIGPNGRRRTKLKLEKVVEHESAKTRQFSMQFGCPEGGRMPDATYEIEHAGLGRFSLYLAATSAAQSDAAGYRADFNLLA